MSNTFSSKICFILCQIVKTEDAICTGCCQISIERLTYPWNLFMWSKFTAGVQNNGGDLLSVHPPPLNFSLSFCWCWASQLLQQSSSSIFMKIRFFSRRCHAGSLVRLVLVSHVLMTTLIKICKTDGRLASGFLCHEGFQTNTVLIWNFLWDCSFQTLSANLTPLSSTVWPQLALIFISTARANDFRSPHQSPSQSVLM